MLKSLMIRDFRSIVATTVNGVEQPLDFGRLNLFIGPNGAGKSNVLEAIGIISAALGRGIGERDLVDRGVRMSPQSSFISFFREQKLSKEFFLEASTEHCTYAVSIMSNGSLAIQTEFLDEIGKKLFEITINGKMSVGFDPILIAIAERFVREPTRSSFDVLKALLPLSKDARSELEILATYAIFTPETAVLRSQARYIRHGSPLGLTGEGLASAVADFDSYVKTLSEKNRVATWSRVLDSVRASGWADDIDTSETFTEGHTLFFKDKYMISGSSMLSAIDASEGALYMLFFALLLAHPKSPKAFALDNVDGSLNPAMVRYLIKHIRTVVDADPTRQVFMTSHNPTSLDEIDLFNDDYRVYVVHRNDKGHTEFYRLQPNPGMTREEWRERFNDRNLSALWVDGDIPYALSDGDV